MFESCPALNIKVKIMGNKQKMSSKEKDENPSEKVICKSCGNDTFRVYITTIIDDARLYCTKCERDPENQNGTSDKK